MAILDSTKYLRCNCGNTEHRIEDRALITVEGKDSVIYKTEPFKAIVCCKCGKVLDKVDKFSNKVIIDA